MPDDIDLRKCKEIHDNQVDISHDPSALTNIAKFGINRAVDT